MECLFWLRLDCGGIDDTPSGISSFLATRDWFFVPEGILPVSYTHLDVYKRQSLHPRAGHVPQCPDTRLRATLEQPQGSVHRRA